MLKRRLVLVAVFIVGAVLSVHTATPTFPNNWTFKGFYRITNQGGINFSAMQSITQVTSGTYSGSWFGVLNRNQLYDVVQIHMPDDASGYSPDTASKNLGCSSSPGVGNNYNLPPTITQTSQTAGCAMSLVQDWGTFLCSNLSSTGKTIHTTCTPPAPFTGIFTDQYDAYGIWWDTVTSRLYLSYGDFYSCLNNEVLLSIDISGGPGHAVVYGPWILSVAGTQLNCGEAQRSYRNAPVAITGSNDALITGARSTGLATPCATAAACNAQQTVVYPYNGGTTYTARSVKSFFATGSKASGTGGSAPWSPDLFLCDQPVDTTPKDTLLDCLKLIYWQQPNSGNGITVTDDLGVVHTNIQQVGSRMLRRDPYGVMMGHNAQGSITGTPLDASVPYGRYWTDQTQGIGSSTGFAREGWAPGIDNSGDQASHIWCVEEGASTGCFYFGSYAIGWNWYGVGTAYSDDFDACSANTGNNTCSGTGVTTYPPGSQTKFLSWDGINSSHFGPQSVISTISVANPTVITTATPHGYASGQTVWIGGLNFGPQDTETTPRLLGGYTATVTGANTFTIPVNITGSNVDGAHYVVNPCGGPMQPVCIPINAMTAPASSTVTSITAANPTHITTSAAETFNTGDMVWFTNTNSTPVLSGPYTVTKIDTTHFTIPVNVSLSGNAGTVIYVGTGGNFTSTGRWLQSISFAAVSTGGDVCSADGTGSRTTTGLTTGYNPCGYVYGRRNGGKGYNSEWTVPAIWSYNLGDIIASLEGTYSAWNTTGNGHVNTTGFLPYNVDWSDFQVMNSLYNGTSDILGMSAAYPNSWAYANKTDNYNEKTPRAYANFEVYYRPTTGSGGPTGIAYIMNDSSVSNTLVVDVLAFNASGCSDTAPVAPTGVATATQSSQSISVSWSGSSDNNWSIIRCVGGAASCVGLSASNSPFLDTGLQPSTTYNYTVSAVNLCNTQASAAPVNGTTAAGPPVSAGGTRVKGLTTRKGHHE